MDFCGYHTSRCSVHADNVVEISSDEDENPGEGEGQLQIEAGPTAEDVIVCKHLALSSHMGCVRYSEMIMALTRPQISVAI